MKISEIILGRQLEYLHQHLQVNIRSRTIIKGWCITVWLGIIIIMLTQRDVFSQLRTQLTIFGPIIFFWVLEAVEAALTVLDKKQMLEIEKRLAEKKFEVSEASECFIISRYEKFTRSDKFCAFITSFFTGEMILSFYAMLAFASVIFLWLLF